MGFSFQTVLTLVRNASDFQVWVSEYWAWFGDTAISAETEMRLL